VNNARRPHLTGDPVKPTPDELAAHAAAHFNAGAAGVDAMFDAFRQLGETISAQRAEQRQKARDARNARRRARYRANPPAPRRPVVVDDNQDDWEPGCRCAVMAMPPCAWCTEQPAPD